MKIAERASDEKGILSRRKSLTLQKTWRFLTLSGCPGEHCTPYLKPGFPTPTPPHLLPLREKGGWLPDILVWRKQYMVTGPDGQDPKENMAAFGFFRQGAEGSLQVWNEASPTNNRGRVKDYFLPSSPWRRSLKYLKIKLHCCAQVPTNSNVRVETGHWCGQPALSSGGWGIHKTVLMLQWEC